jgi:CheY-like chemotaxis protein
LQHGCPRHADEKTCPRKPSSTSNAAGLDVSPVIYRSTGGGTRLVSVGAMRHRVRRQVTHSELKRRLLIVDDEEDLRLLLAEHFESVGYEVETAGDGNEAIARALKLRPDLIILDLFLPRLDGWDTMKILRTYPTMRDTPLVAYTWADDEGLSRANALGCRAIARKPCSAQVVEVIVNEVLRRADDPEASEVSSRRRDGHSQPVATQAVRRPLRARFDPARGCEPRDGRRLGHRSRAAVPDDRRPGRRAHRGER